MVVQKESGFTLIELIIDLAILMMLLILLIFLIDPITQINKAKNNQKQHDLNNIQNALNLYYQDHECFPSTIPFGQEWKENGIVFMKKVPQDESCNTPGGVCYIYMIDLTSNCPQWNVAFAKLTTPLDPRVNCSLDSTCLPQNYALSGYNYCAYSGNLDCNKITSYDLPTSPTITPTPTGSLTPPATLTPTPTSLSSTPSPTPPGGQGPSPTPTPLCQNYYACTGENNACNSFVNLGDCTFNGGRIQCYCGVPGCVGNACCQNQCR